MSTGKKILVIDDEQHIRMLYGQELAEEGYVVVSSDGTDDILQLIAKEKPACVVLDINLSADVSGLDILQEIRTVHQDLPVLLCSAYSSFKSDFKSVAADGYVVKSVDLTELKEKLVQLIK